MSFLICINIIGLALVIIGVIHVRRCIKQKSGIALAIIFLFVSVLILIWAIFSDVLVLIGYKG